VPSDATEAGPLAAAPERVLALALREHTPAEVAEHELSAEVPVPLESGEHVLAERDVARLGPARPDTGGL
jgi:hypothetical protein